MNQSSEQAIAHEIFDHLEGTLIADLKSLRKASFTYAENENGEGGLNYTVFLVSLVGCETLGRYAYGADLDKSSEKQADVGGYICRFIENYFPNKSPYKSVSKIMADYLRHVLVHGFAPRKDGYGFDLSLFVSKIDEGESPSSYENKGRKSIKLDGTSFINGVIEAFYSLKKELASNPSLAVKVFEAEKYSENASPPRAVSNQFNVAYDKFNK